MSAIVPTLAKGAASNNKVNIIGSIILIPRNMVLLFLYGYRATISHLYGDVCRYYPSCSAYAVGAVQQHGASKGIFLFSRRIIRCHPWAQGGIDDPPLKKKFRYGLTPHGFVVSPRKDRRA